MAPEALKVWTEGAAMELTTEELTCLRDALARDDPALIQGSSTSPDLFQARGDEKCDGACILGYAPWITQSINTVAEVSDAMTQMWNRISSRLKDSCGCRHLVEWWDAVPRAEGVATMLGLVEAELTKRKGEM